LVLGSIGPMPTASEVSPGLLQGRNKAQVVELRVKMASSLEIRGAFQA